MDDIHHPINAGNAPCCQSIDSHVKSRALHPQGPLASSRQEPCMRNRKMSEEIGGVWTWAGRANPSGGPGPSRAAGCALAWAAPGKVGGDEASRTCITHAGLLPRHKFLGSMNAEMEHSIGHEDLFDSNAMVMRTS